MLLLLVPVALLILFRLHAFGGPLETDECNYAYIGERLLAGDRLYVDLWDHQPPGVFLLFSGLIAVIGKSETAIRAFAMVWALATCLLIYRCVRSGLGPRAAWFAALLYAFASSDPGMAGEGANREIYMNALAMGGLALLLPVRRGDQAVPRSLVRVGLSGVLLGLASTIKTVAAAQWLCLAVALGLWQWRRERQPLRRVALLILVFGLGPALIWAGLFLYFAATDRLTLFWEAVFAYNVGYSGLGSGILGRFGAFFTRWDVFRTALPLWLGGAAGLIIAAVQWRRRAPWSVLVVAMTVGSYIATSLPGLFWNHYYLLTLPCLAILAAALFDAVSPAGATTPKPTNRRQVTAVAFAVTLCSALLACQALWYLLAPTDAVGFPRYRGPRMLWVRDQAAHLATVTEPDDTVFVWGRADTGMYYYADRRCASRFTMIGGLIGDDPATRQRQSLLLADLARHPPRVIVIKLSKHNPPFPDLQRFLQKHRYVSAGRDPGRMEVLCDVERPIPRIDWTWSREPR